MFLQVKGFIMFLLFKLQQTNPEQRHLSHQCIHNMCLNRVTLIFEITSKPYIKAKQYAA